VEEDGRLGRDRREEGPESWDEGERNEAVCEERKNEYF
jgi:hypothetical protein